MCAGRPYNVPSACTELARPPGAWAKPIIITPLYFLNCLARRSRLARRSSHRYKHDMKNLALALASLSSINCQKLSGKCESGDLVIEIPYSSTLNSAQLLYLEAGTCDQTNYGGSILNNADTSSIQITVPIDACDLRVQSWCAK